MDSEAGPSNAKRQRLADDDVRAARHLHGDNEYSNEIKQESIDIVEDDLDVGAAVVKEEYERDPLEGTQSNDDDPSENEDGSDYSEEIEESFDDDEDEEGGHSLDECDDPPPLRPTPAGQSPEASAPAAPPRSGNSSEDEEDSALRWSTKCTLKKIEFTKRNEFFGKVTGEKPIDYFNFFFSEEFLTMICTETNAQAQRLLLSGTKEFCRVTEWKDISVVELRVFLGLLFHMGNISILRVQDYWKKSRLFSVPIFSRQMARNRFILILRCLHFTSEPVMQDPIYKIRKLINYFNSKMTECYYPARDLAVHKCVVSWRGRLSLDLRNKAKHPAGGIHLSVLTELDGFVLKINAMARGNRSEARIREVVMQLLEGKLGNGHAVYLESYYSSAHLAKILLDNATLCTGILRKDSRELPKYLIKKKLPEGLNFSLFKDELHLGKWRSRQATVYYITTQYGDKMVQLTNGSILKPEAVVKYTLSIAEGSRVVQLSNHNPFEQRTFMRWDLKIAIHIFQTLLANSFLAYNKYSGKKKTVLYEYRLQVIDALLPETNAPTVPAVAKSMEMHQIKKIVERTKSGRNKRRACRHCWLNGRRRSDSPWYCATCPDAPGLCVRCFAPYHAR